MASRQFGRITVRARSTEELVNFHFTDRVAFDLSLRALQREFDVTDSFWGYEMFHNADEVLACARTFCREASPEQKRRARIADRLKA